MPTYEFECKKCKEKITRMFVKIAERNTQKCEKCGGNLNLLISTPHFKVKGFNAANSYGVHEKLGEIMDRGDKEYGREPRGEKLNESVLKRKARKKMPKLI